jgi:alpha-amylase
MGFDAIWVSPITQQVADPTRAYTGYMQTHLHGTNANFGTPDDLRALSAALHKRSMYLMVDVVANHFGAPGPASSINYSYMEPFDRQEYFHNICWISDEDFSSYDANVQLCWLGNEDYPVPDGEDAWTQRTCFTLTPLTVNTTQPAVWSIYASWIQSLVANYSVDGLRIDTVKHVEPSFWGGFQAAAGVLALGEVADGNVPYVCPFQSTPSNRVVDGLLSYPLYYQATHFFQSPANSSSALIGTAQATNSSCADPTLLGTFTENHDQPRFASLTEDMSLAHNLLVWTLLSDGIPIVYAGQEQHYSGDGNTNREAIWTARYNTSAPLAKLVTTLNAIRHTAIKVSNVGAYSSSRADWFYYDPHKIGISKGPKGSNVVFAVTNLGSGSGMVVMDLGTAHGYPQGTSLTEVLTCKAVVVGTQGDLNVTIVDGMPQVFYPSAKLSGSGLCGH